jgi:pSer/pThr/pTyr-binding forkhead associated (FHA) protein
MGPRQTPHPADIPVLRVRTEDGREYRFAEAFKVGRGDECAVRVHDAQVSRQHLGVDFEGGAWVFRDLHSGNGVFLDGQKVSTAPIEGSVTLLLGADGPTMTLEVEGARSTRSTPPPAPTVQAPARETVLLSTYAQRYFGSAQDDEPVGRRTMMIRRAFQDIRKRERRRYTWVVAILAALGLAAGGYALYGHRQMARQRTVALDLFYAMKSLDLDIANLERLVAQSGNVQGQEQVKRYLERRRDMERTYDSFLAGLNLYDRPLSEQERLILRVTRLLGECEIAAPPDYINEVMSYIQKWQSSQRFVNAVAVAREKGYTKPIVNEFLGQNLPPQFFYLAMQESNFDPFASGPPTSWGIAKGMWQFIPDTARRYGLNVGPLEGVPQADAADDRHKWDRATVAAARYIKDIYSTDAQASGLLVMASYNWGEGRVIRLIRSLSPNPRDRNFWTLLDRYRNQVPKQTYDYVFYIVAAAVIGENPRLFGIPVDPPLGFLEGLTAQLTMASPAAR